jgi:3-oxoacyl-[acyl-carrier-protein] synthase III
MTSISIKAVDIYHPEKSENNEYYIEYFKKKGRDITSFLEFMGRKERYFIDNKHENSITMAIEASKRVLKKAQLAGEDIDLIIFSTQVPEKTFPTNVMYVHNAIGGKHSAIALDMNVNCAGMTTAVDMASRYLSSNPYMKRALVVGSDYLSLLANPDEEISFANFGDASSAVILEKTADDNIGFIDTIYDIDSDNRNNIQYPEMGLSRSITEKIDGQGIKWLPFDGSMILPATYEMIETLLKRNHLKIDDINGFCLSQFALSNILKVQEHFEISSEKIIYVGDEYGYTGTSSPFIALYEGIESGQIRRGDYVLFWTVGGGHELIAMLFKY